MSPKEIVRKMLEKDAFSKWLGIEVLELDVEFCKLQMTAREEMLNGFEILHGGITYSLADSTLAFAANAGGQQSVSIETSISHTKPVKAGEVLVATCTKKHSSKALGHYDIVVEVNGEAVAFFKGIVYRTRKKW